MQGFKFRLQPVLEQRIKKEQEAALAQARAHQEYLRQAEELQKLQDKLSIVLSGEGHSDAFDAINTCLYRQFLQASIARQERAVQKASGQFEKCRQATIEARKQKLILEKLKEKQLASYLNELSRKEKKMQDELAMRLSSHLLREGGEPR